MNSYPILVLTQKAEVKQGKLSCETVNLDVIQKYFKKKTEVDMLGTYLYKGVTLFLFGYTKGKAGNENKQNKHELPPPHDGTLVFGDIVIIASKDPNSFTTPIPFKVDEYEQFYSKAFGGFDEIDGDDEDDDYEEEEGEAEAEAEAEGEEKNILEEEVETDHLSYTSEVEEILEVKKEKISKKKVINVTSIVSIHPDLQLKELGEKGDIRMKMIESIKKILNHFNDFNDLEIIELEQQIYKKTLIDSESKHIIKDWSVKLFNTLYLSNVRKIVGNLDTTSYINNKELLQRYKNKEITLEEICSMDYYSLYQSKWKEAIERQKMIEKLQLEGNKSLATEQFLCTKCFKRECTYYEMQTRSADEPMTIFITCLNCGKNWRQ